MCNKYCKILIFFTLFLIVSQTYGQNEQREQKVYLGLGMGLDYGGIFGGKIEYLPVKNFGVFGGIGYNLVSVGYNAGATFKILPDKKVSPNLMIFYGYNGANKVFGASEYDMISYGVTLGGNLDIIVNSLGHKISVGLFVPIRSNKFMNNYDDIKKDPRVTITNDLLPIAIGVGYNFML